MHLLTKWRNKGGVFLIGYTAFRNLSLGRWVKDLNTAREICSALRVRLPITSHAKFIDLYPVYILDLFKKTFHLLFILIRFFL